MAAAPPVANGYQIVLRVIVIAVVVGLVISILAGALRRLFASFMADTSQEDGNQTSVPMVRCEHCGVHIPKTEAFRRGEDFYCSREHLTGRDDSDP